jgi:hypothetical protein
MKKNLTTLLYAVIVSTVFAFSLARAQSTLAQSTQSTFFGDLSIKIYCTFSQFTGDDNKACKTDVVIKETNTTSPSQTTSSTNTSSTPSGQGYVPQIINRVLSGGGTRVVYLPGATGPQGPAGTTTIVYETRLAGQTVSPAVYVNTGSANSPVFQTTVPGDIWQTYIHKLQWDDAVGGNANIQNINATNTFTVNLNAVNFTLGTGTIGTTTVQFANVQNLWANNATTVNSTSTNLFAENASLTNATSTFLYSLFGSILNLFSENATITNATGTNLVYENAALLNATTTNFLGTFATITNATTTNLFGTNASLTNATTTNLFATLLNAVTAFIVDLTAKQSYQRTITRNASSAKSSGDDF